MQETHEIWVPSLGQEDSSGVGNGNPLQYSCQENPMDRGTWSIVMGSQTVGLDWAYICVTRDNFQTVAHLMCVTCNGFSLVSKWNWRWKACKYILKKFSKFIKHVLMKFNLKRTLEWGSQSVRWLSHVWLFATPWTAAHQGSNSWSLRKLMSIESMPSSHLILCRPLLLPPSIFPSIRVFSSQLVLCIRWPNHWSFSFSVSPSNEYSGLISLLLPGKSHGWRSLVGCSPWGR